MHDERKRTPNNATARSRHLGERQQWVRTLLAVIVSVVAVVGQSSTLDAEPCWEPPVEGIVTDPFREPPCPWCAGNRGIEYRVERSTVARATATGRVTFSGVVAGTLYVVVEIANGWRLTYGRLATTRLGQGDVVVAGSVVGRTTEKFFFGMRAGNVYVDPAPFLGRRVGRPRLIPIDGTSARPSTTVSVRCQLPLPSR